MCASVPSSASRKWSGGAIASILIVLACLGAHWILGFTKGGMTAIQGLTVDPAELNFGEVFESERFEWTFSIENSTGKDVAIERFASSCNCLSVEPASPVIPAGGKANVQLQINLLLGTARSGGEERATDVAVDLIPHIRDLAQVRQGVWTIRGRVRRALSLDLGEIDFGTSYPGRPFAPKSAVAIAHAPFESLRATCPPDAAALDVARSEQSPTSFEVRIAPHAGLPPGPFEFDVFLEPTGGPIAPLLPKKKLHVTGIVAAEYQVLPPSLHLSVRQVGETVTETIVLSSVNNKLFEVESIDVDSVSTVVKPSPIAGIPGRTFEVTQQVTKPGKQTSTIMFSLLTQGDEKVVVPFTITWHGQ